MTDNVNHPAHYESQRISIEPIDLCECFDFCIGNAIKYLIRAGKKDGNSLEQDLAKARWYLNRALVRQVKFDSYRPDGKKDERLVGCAVYGYCATNEYLDTLFGPGSSN
ncbi:MAG: DUF3310 domain-containing protein, partial [Duodenibacillus sp.]